MINTVSKPKSPLEIQSWMSSFTAEKKRNWNHTTTISTTPSIKNLNYHSMPPNFSATKQTLTYKNNKENQTKTERCHLNQNLENDPTLESSSKAFSRRSGLISSRTKLSADAIFWSLFIWASVGLTTEELEPPKGAFMDSDMVGDVEIEGPSLSLSFSISQTFLHFLTGSTLLFLSRERKRFHL